MESSFLFGPPDDLRMYTPDDPANLGPLLALRSATVEGAMATESGDLQIRFDTGVLLLVRADPHYEAWTVTGPDGSLVVSQPGGGLAIWGNIS